MSRTGCLGVRLGVRRKWGRLASLCKPVSPCTDAPAPMPLLRGAHTPRRLPARAKLSHLENACLPRPPHPSAATTPMPEPQVQLAAACAAAPAPVVEPARQPSVWRASTDSSHLTHVSEGVSSWLAGWGKLAEEQGCAVSPLETSTIQALLQRVPSQPAPARRVHSPPQEHAPARRPAARASCDFTAGVALQPPRPLQQQWQEGVACYQQYAAPQPALSDGGSNSAGQGPSGER